MVEFLYGPLAQNPHRVGKPLRFQLCLWLLSPDRARRFVLTVRRGYEQRQETYAYEQASFALVEDAVDDPTSPSFAEYATLQYGMMRVNDTIAWCDWLLDRLDRAVVTVSRDGGLP